MIGNKMMSKMPCPSPVPVANRRATIIIRAGAAAAAGGETLRRRRNADAAAVAPPGRSPSSRKQLDSALRAEIAARAKDPFRSAARTPPSPWILLGTENTGRSETKLKRTYEGEGGKEDMAIPYIYKSAVLYDYVRFDVTLSKGPNSVEFECETTWFSKLPFGGPFTIRKVKHTTQALDNPFARVTEEVQFSSLPRAVQSGFYAYLQDRGIDRKLCSYLLDLVARSDEEKKKDQEYVTWLSKLQAYVKL